MLFIIQVVYMYNIEVWLILPFYQVLFVYSSKTFPILSPSPHIMSHLKHLPSPHQVPYSTSPSHSHLQSPFLWNPYSNKASSHPPKQLGPESNAPQSLPSDLIHPLQHPKTKTRRCISINHFPCPTSLITTVGINHLLHQIRSLTVWLVDITGLSQPNKFPTLWREQHDSDTTHPHKSKKIYPNMVPIWVCRKINPRSASYLRPALHSQLSPRAQPAIPLFPLRSLTSKRVGRRYSPTRSLHFLILFIF